MNTLTAEIFAVGRWNGLEFTLEDLKLIASAFHSLGDNHQVPLKMGHNDEQPFTDGQPALGWVTNVWVEGNKLLAEFSDVPDVVYSSIGEKLYKNVSIELDFGVQYKGEFLTYVLSGVALLGADLPAVKVLADLTTYMGRTDDAKRAGFSKVTKRLSFNFKSEGRHMATIDDQELATLKAKAAQVDALSQQVTTLTTEKVAATTELETTKQNFSKLQTDVQTAKFAQAKEAINKRLDKLVEAKVMLPAKREEFMAKFKDDQTVIDSLNFSLEALEGALPSEPTGDTLNEGGKSNKGSEGAKDDEGKTADVVLFERAKKAQRESNGTLSFSQARQVVLQEDAELAKAYLAISEGGA